MNNTTTTARPHIVWLDALRFVAILMVIACHCTDPFNASPESRANPDFNFWGSAYGSMLRACVPLFVMMTGFLLLPVKQEASVFYKKRIPRVFFPFLIWSVLFNLAPWFIQWVGGSPELVTDLRTQSFSFFGRRVERCRYDTAQFYRLRNADVVYLCFNRIVSLYACLFCLGGKSIRKG